MTEKIIIDGKNKECKILFSCKHIDDSAAYDLIRKKNKITPKNAPVGNFELMLIENTNSPYGFSSICKRNNNEDVWEYSGFGHSGACSIVTALLKQLARKTEECEKLINKNNRLEEELNQIKLLLDGKNTQYEQKLKECEEYKKEAKKADRICTEITEFLRQRTVQFLEEKREVNNQLKAEKQKVKELEEKYKWYDHYKDSALYNKDLCNKKSDEIDKYKQALEEIKEITEKLIINTPEYDNCYYKEECGENYRKENYNAKRNNS